MLHNAYIIAIVREIMRFKHAKRKSSSHLLNSFEKTKTIKRNVIFLKG